MARGDGRTSPTGLEQWRERLADAEEEIERLQTENDELRGRLEEIAAIAGPDQAELMQQFRARTERIEAMLSQALAKKVVIIDGSAEPAS